MKIHSPVLLLVFLVLFSALVYAQASVVTINAPIANLGIKGTFNITATITRSSGNNITNATFYYRTGTSGAWTFIGDERNQSDGDSSYAFAVNTATLTESATGQFNVTLSNRTEGGGQGIGNPTSMTATVTGLNVDNTNPTISSQNAQKFDRSIQVQCRSADTLDTALTYIFFLYSPSNIMTQTSNKTGYDYTFDSSDVSYPGSWKVGCEAVDDSFNVIWASNNTFQVSGSDDLGGTMPASQAAMLFGMNKSLAMGLGILALVVMLIIIAVIVVAVQRG